MAPLRILQDMVQEQSLLVYWRSKEKDEHCLLKEKSGLGPRSLITIPEPPDLLPMFLLGTSTV